MTKVIALLDNERELKKDKDRVFPNLALMKISSYYKSIGYHVEWLDTFKINEYEKIFFSKVFTFKPYCDKYHYIVDSSKLIEGGTGVDSKIKLPKEIEKMFPDYSIYPNVDFAVGFLTRGCNNMCEWCVVPGKEGKVRFNNCIEDIERKDVRKIKFLDNNILQYIITNNIRMDSSFIQGLIDTECTLDFNQGLDIRMVNKNIAELLSKITWTDYIRFSCDTVSQLKYFKTKLKLLKSVGISERQISIYLLVRDISEAEERVDYFRKNHRKVHLYAQPYQDLANKVEVTSIQNEFAKRYIYSGKWRKLSWKEYVEKGYCRCKI